MITYVRWRRDQPREGGVCKLLEPGNAMALWDCPACGRPLGTEHPVQLLAIGPLNDEDRDRHRAGGWYSAVALVMHAHCLGTDTSTTPAPP